MFFQRNNSVLNESSFVKESRIGNIKPNSINLYLLNKLYFSFFAPNEFLEPFPNGVILEMPSNQTN